MRIEPKQGEPPEHINSDDEDEVEGDNGAKPRMRQWEYRETCLLPPSNTDDESRRARTTGSESRCLGSVQEITTDSTRAFGESPEWEELDMMVDHGESVTVINHDMVKAVDAQEAKPSVRYEVADGRLIGNMGRQTFNAVTNCEVLHKMKAEVTDVKKALLSVFKLVKSGNRVVFAEGDCFIENTTTKQKIPIEERGGAYVLKVWINRDQGSPF